MEDYQRTVSAAQTSRRRSISSADAAAAALETLSLAPPEGAVSFADVADDDEDSEDDDDY